MDKILVVDDNQTNLKILNLILGKAGYETISSDNPNLVVEMVTEKLPDIILLDINMPDIDGLELCKRIKAVKEVENIPVIFISALNDTDTIVNSFSNGAVDYITKPFRAEEVKARIATHLKIKKLEEELKKSNNRLERKVKEQVKLISDTQMETIFSLAKLAQSRDDDTGKHLERVQKYCYALAKELSENSAYSDIIDDDFIKNIVNASPLHDIGKVGISDLILLKPGKLTHDEFEIMKTHTTIGFTTLEEVDKKFGANEFIAMGKVIARSHHERWDGTGYPDRLQGDYIPLPARIMSIADVYDALSTKRVYKDALPQEKCIEIIKENRGTQFDPAIVDSFLKIAPEFAKIREEVRD